MLPQSQFNFSPYVFLSISQDLHIKYIFFKVIGIKTSEDHLNHNYCIQSFCTNYCQTIANCLISGPKLPRMILLHLVLLKFHHQHLYSCMYFHSSLFSLYICFNEIKPKHKFSIEKCTQKIISQIQQGLHYKVNN